MTSLNFIRMNFGTVLRSHTCISTASLSLSLSLSLSSTVLLVLYYCTVTGGGVFE